MAKYVNADQLISCLRADLPYKGAIKRCLIQAPEEDVAPVRHGHWVRCYEDWRKQVEGDKCSHCGFEHYGASITYYHYCPNCGAKMEVATQ